MRAWSERKSIQLLEHIKHRIIQYVPGFLICLFSCTLCYSPLHKIFAFIVIHCMHFCLFFLNFFVLIIVLKCTITKAFSRLKTLQTNDNNYDQSIKHSKVYYSPRDSQWGFVLAQEKKNEGKHMTKYLLRQGLPYIQ